MAGALSVTRRRHTVGVWGRNGRLSAVRLCGRELVARCVGGSAGGGREVIATKEEVQEVKKLRGVRLEGPSMEELMQLSEEAQRQREENTSPSPPPEAPSYSVEYLVEWKDEKLVPSWEPASCIAEDVLRDFESEWWKLAKTADPVAMSAFLDQGRELLSRTRDSDGRSALHYVAGRGNVDCARLLVAAGAELDAIDKDGYTPLHLAAGYMHTPLVIYLLEQQADPEIEDKAGRSVVELTADLWRRVPPTPENFDKRIQLQSIAEKVDGLIYEESMPSAITDRRESLDGSVEYLVDWQDGKTPTWEPAENLSSQLMRDYDNELEYADAVKLLDRRSKEIEFKGMMRSRTEYLVEWSDASEPTWEPLSHVTAALIEGYEANLSEAQKTSFENELDEFEDAELEVQESKQRMEEEERKLAEGVSY